MDSPFLLATLTAQDYLSVAGQQILPSVLAPIGGELAVTQFGVKRIIGSAVGVGAGSVINGEAERPYTGQSQGQIFANAGVNAAASYAANQIVGSVPGRDVRSLNANFVTGAHMQNEIQTGVVSQGIQSGLSSLLGQLSSALISLSAALSSIHSAR